jgi:predicted metal-dependent enzyme (double-stranded beta helix superfamily)
MFDLDRFIETCRGVAHEPHGPKQVLELMREAIADPAALKAAVPPLPEGKNVLTAPLFRSPEMTVLNAALQPGLVSIPHDHHMWAVIGIYDGEEANTFYRRAEGRLEVANTRTIHAGEAILLGADVIHAIENPLGRPTLGLHVYGGDLLGAARAMWDPATGEERVYDVPEFNRLSRDLALKRRAERAAASPA